VKKFLGIIRPYRRSKWELGAFDLVSKMKNNAEKG
jgi:hypothetical protein